MTKRVSATPTSVTDTLVVLIIVMTAIDIVVIIIIIIITIAVIIKLYSHEYAAHGYYNSDREIVTEQ